VESPGGPGTDQQAQHRDHVEGLADQGQPEQRELAADEVQQPQPDHSAADAERHRDQDQERGAPLALDDDHLEMAEGHRDPHVAAERSSTDTRSTTNHTALDEKMSMPMSENSYPASTRATGISPYREGSHELKEAKRRPA
jgi:hypothetical protein